MLTFSFTVGSADDARTAAEVCDFLAERMATGATPTRRPRSSKAADTVQLPNDKPAEQVKDPAALYAALAAVPAAKVAVYDSTVPLVVSAETAEIYGVKPTAEVAATQTREERVAEVRKTVSGKGGKWFGDYIKEHKLDGKKLSDYSDAELDAINTAAAA